MRYSLGEIRLPFESLSSLSRLLMNWPSTMQGGNLFASIKSSLAVMATEKHSRFTALVPSFDVVVITAESIARDGMGLVHAAISASRSCTLPASW